MRRTTTAMAMILLATGCSGARAPEVKTAEQASPPPPPVAVHVETEGAVPEAKVAAHDEAAETASPSERRADAESDGERARPSEEAPAKAVATGRGDKDDARMPGKPVAASSGRLAALGGVRTGGGSVAKRVTSDEVLAEAGPSRGAPMIARAAASVRAGEWDDNANYREFQKYLAMQSGLPFEKLDLSHRRFVVVRDAHGKAVPNCRVTVRDEAQHAAVLTTTAAGRALLFPRALGLGGDSLTATADCIGEHVSMRLDARSEDGVVDLQLAADRAPVSRTIDLVFVLDTTGSMSEEIDAVKDTIAKVASEVGHGQTTFRVALVEYKDKGDSFVTRVHPFSQDVASFSREIAAVQASGGGDMPEHANEGLRVALDGLAWNDAASARLAFLVGDAPPHLDYQDDAGYGRSLRSAASRGIQLYTVAASGMDAVGQAVWRQIAQFTGATNLFVMRGGAGPQSTGAGDPTSSCGGTHSNYTSANLDQLILKKLSETERLLDADPLRIAGVGRDENAKPCGERLVLAE